MCGFRAQNRRPVYKFASPSYVDFHDRLDRLLNNENRDFGRAM
jgi:hypothetical protein